MVWGDKVMCDGGDLSIPRSKPGFWGGMGVEMVFKLDQLSLNT
jgi:hypothetical protein